MRKNIVFLLVLMLVATGAVLAATAPTHQAARVKAAKEPVAPVETAPEPAYNDGWYDVFPVQMEGSFDGGRHLDFFDSTITFDDFEGGEPAWTSADLDAGTFWHLDDTLTSGHEPSWWCGDVCLAVEGVTGGAYNDHWLQYLISDTFSLQGLFGPTLKFLAHWKMEDTDGASDPYDMWDAWNVWISTDLGNNWTVLTPTRPSYTGTSSYAFGSEWGMGPDIPGYSGTTEHADEFEEIEFNLNAYSGQAQVLLRWAFCSDPASSGSDNPSWYGLMIDSIRVTGGAITRLSNDGELDEFLVEVGEEAPDVWVYDTSTYHSATHCWTGQQDTNATRGLYSYPITIPAGYQFARLSYWVWCDMPDENQPPPDDDYLADYYQIMVSNAGCLAWSQVVYDYGYDNFEDSPGGDSEAGWVLRQHGLTSGGVQVDTIGLSAYIGQEIRVAFRMTTDDTLLTGTGLHIDDVEIVCTRYFDHDLSGSNLTVPFPTTVGLPTSFQYDVTNDGLNAEGPPINTDYWVYRPDASTQMSGSNNLPSTTLQPQEGTSLSINWTPDACGSYLIGAKSSLAGDEDTSNDTTESPINSPLDPNENLAVTVQPAGLYELAYHTRDYANGFINPRYVRYTPVDDGVPSPDADNYDILQIKIIWQFEEDLADTGGTAWIEFWEDSTAEHPSDSLIYRLVTKIDSNETMTRSGDPHWWVYDLSAIPELQNRSGDFWVSVSGKDTLDGSPLPTLLGESVVPEAYDGHNFVVRLDSLPEQPLMPSPGRYLIQVMIGEAKPVDDLTILRDGTSNNVTLRWTSVSACASYKVYRLATPFQDYTTGTLLTPTPITGTSYTDTGIVSTSGKNFYAVIAVY